MPESDGLSLDEPELAAVQNDLTVDVGIARYSLFSPPVDGRSGRGRCSVLLRRGRAWRFRRVTAFFTWPGTWVTSSKTLSLGLSFWPMVVSPFCDVFAGFRLRVLAVGAGELAFLDWGAPALGFLRGLRTAITKVDSKVCSLAPIHRKDECRGVLKG